MDRTTNTQLGLSHVGLPERLVQLEYLIYKVYRVQIEDGLTTKEALARVDDITTRQWYYYWADYKAYFHAVQAKAAAEVLEAAKDAANVTFLAKAQAQIHAEQEVLAIFPKLISQLVQDAIEGDAATRLRIVRELRDGMRDGFLLGISVPRGTTIEDAKEFEEQLKAVPLDLLDKHTITLTDGRVISLDDGETIEQDCTPGVE